MRAALATGLLVLAACNACSGGKITIQAAPVVQWDGGADDAAHACAILNAVQLANPGSCADGADVTLCAEALRNDQAQGVGAMFDPQCIIKAGPNLSALQACGACK
jgi:hypothetical protein